METVSLSTTQKVENKRIWIAYAFGAALCFTICNEAISEITSKTGPVCVFYFSSGGIVCGLIYHVFNCFRNIENRTNMALVINGKLDCVQLLGFVAFCFVYFAV